MLHTPDKGVYVITENKGALEKPVFMEKECETLRLAERKIRNTGRKMACIPCALIVLSFLISGCGRVSSPASAIGGAGETYVGPAPGFSEVVPANKSTYAAADGKYYPWVELVNTQDTSVQLQEHYLTNDRAAPTLWQFPSVVMAPGERRIVFLSGLNGMGGEMHAPFTLGEQDTELFLYDLDGNLADTIRWSGPVMDNLAVIRVNGSVMYTAFPTPGTENDERAITDTAPTAMDESEPVILNELLRKSTKGPLDKNGRMSGWVELYNRSSAPVSLLGYGLSTSLDGSVQWLFPNVTIEPEGYTLVFLSGEANYLGELHASFTAETVADVLALVNLGTNTIDFIPVHRDVSAIIPIARTEEGRFKAFADATPGMKNEGLYFDVYRDYQLAK